MLVVNFSPIRPLSVSSGHEYMHDERSSLLDDDDDDDEDKEDKDEEEEDKENRYVYSFHSEINSHSPSFDLQHSSQYSSTINNIVLHYKSHGGLTGNSLQDGDSIHSSSYTKSVNSQGGT